MSRLRDGTCTSNSDGGSSRWHHLSITPAKRNHTDLRNNHNVITILREVDPTCYGLKSLTLFTRTSINARTVPVVKPIEAVVHHVRLVLVWVGGGVVTVAAGKMSGHVGE